MGIGGALVKDSPFMTLKEAACEARFTKNGFRKMLKDGRVPGAFKVGSQWRIPENFIEKFDWNFIHTHKKEKECSS